MLPLTRFHWRLIGSYLLGTLLVAPLAAMATQNLPVGVGLGALFGGLPGVILATNYTFGVWPFGHPHPIDEDDE